MEKIEEDESIHLYKSEKNIKTKNYKLLKNTNEKQKEKVRYLIFDNYKGILIFAVVFGHFLWYDGNKDKESLSRKIVIFIYFFHMHGFVFISGFLSSENSIRISNAFKLLILYYIFNFSFSLIIHYYINASINFLFPKYSYWYILSLFYWRISIKYIYNIKYIFIISIILSLLVGYFDFITNIFSLVRTITFFPYFLAGYKIAKYNFNTFLNWRKDINKLIIFIFLFLFFLNLIIEYINKNHYKISNSTLLMHKYQNDNSIKERIIIMIISSIMILFFLLLIPNFKMPLITKWGQNSLYIYLFHRIFTIIVNQSFYNKKLYSNNIIQFSFLFTLLILLTFSSKRLNKNCNEIINYIHKNLLEFNDKGKIIAFFFGLSFIFLLSIDKIMIYFKNKIFNIKIKEEITTSNELNIKEIFNNSIRISYIGDLILLKDQVISAKNDTSGKYEFDEIFQYTSSHFHESDLTIGIYEGPSAGNITSYSSSNYGDGLPLYLNFPDEFAEAVKKAGINVVTTANNHLLDKNIEGAKRTLDILDKYNITHVGSYRNQEEKDKIIMIDVQGIKIALLAYTSKMNYYKMDTLYEKYNYITRIIPNKKKSKYYNEIFDDIKNDFIKVKNASPDIIIVLAHMGTQFLHSTDDFQDEWNQIFTELGADIILGDHSHSVQPLQYIENTFIVNSPGNFVNSYTKKDGDSTAIIDIYISKLNKKVIGASVIPMYTREIRPKYFSAIPIYDLINNKSLKLSENERKRIEEIQLMSTKVLLGKEFGINDVKKNYFFINNSYYDFDKNENYFCDKLNKYYSERTLYKYINNSNSITFIGDSITKGTKNGYHPWYEPMINCFKNKKIINISKGSYTTKLILKNYKYDIIQSNSDLYIIAIGTNDIRYRKASTCAMNSKEYINQIDKIVNLAKNKNKDCKFVFIAPWFSTHHDPVTKLTHKDKKAMRKKYSLELENYAKNNDYIFIDPNEYLERIVYDNVKKYLVDYIHPNNNDGIELYCEGVLAISNQFF